MSFMVAISTYGYDLVFKRHRWRWKAFWITIGGLAISITLLTDNPLGFVFRHFTFNPETGYYRLLIWQEALQYIFIFPLTGDPTGSAWMSDDILSNSIDCVWLVLALFHGLPTVLFLLLASVTACIGTRQGTRRALDSFDMQWMMHMRTGMSMVLAMFAFIGLSVHFWDAIWMFWALCIGIRASLEEYCSVLNRRELSDYIAMGAKTYSQNFRPSALQIVERSAMPQL
jgi:hypothetical protein